MAYDKNKAVVGTWFAKSRRKMLEVRYCQIQVDSELYMDRGDCVAGYVRGCMTQSMRSKGQLCHRVNIGESGACALSLASKSSKM